MKHVLATILLLLLATMAQAVPVKFIKHAESDAVPGQYIVKYQDGVHAPSVTTKLAGFYKAVGVRWVFEHAFAGAVLNIDEARALALSKDPLVELVEQDFYVRLAMVQQCLPTWGLDRIDQVNLPLDQIYSFNNTAGCVHVYVVDTGIRSDHVEFGGRVDTVNNFTAINDGLGAEDCTGHGTHVAGTIGSHTYGVAKRVTLHSLRVWDCQSQGTAGGIIAAVNWATANAVFPAVVNMSMEWSPPSTLIEGAITNSINAGLTYVVAAGNWNTDACGVTPARMPAVITVGAIDATDTRSYWWALQSSNYGPCLDLFAPGSAVTSTEHISPTAIGVRNGTSMAAPHVAGIAALYLANNQTATPAQVHQAVVNGASAVFVNNAGPGSPHLIAYSLINGCP